MIPQNNIIAWRLHAPWSSDAQVEQDLVISRALVEMYSNPIISSELVFRGGTALHKLFLPNTARYSEDIDLEQIKAGPNGHLIDAFRSVLDNWLGEPKRKIKKDKISLIYRFNSEIAPIIPLRLKIEINVSENFSVDKLQKKMFVVKNPWFSGGVEILTFSIEELLGTKLRAFYQRKKGRDLFDLFIFLKNDKNINKDKIINCFQTYLKKSDLQISRAQFEANIDEKLNDPNFLTDIYPLLTPSVKDFDTKIAINFVLNNLISKLPGLAWSKKK